LSHRAAFFTARQAIAHIAAFRQFADPGKRKYGRALVGRNDPCPCGSGKKFKKCCMGKGIFD
ncbi:MAG: SEC-C domain-containing protein, partial [Solobacterium sp.]|nr:SEC-C domain-containing protein [Solobacterium sp.]